MATLLRNRSAELTPFEAIWDAQRGLESLLDSMWGRPTQPAYGWNVPADLVQTEEEIRCTLEVPGLKAEEIDVTVENGVLVVAGEKKADYEEQDKGGAVYRERRYGRFERRFALPQNVNANGVRASYEQGVLTIVLPRAEESKPRRVQIKTGGAATQIQG